jgi:hypothetical protein
MGKLRRLALASLEICSYIGRVAIQFSMHLRNSALNNRMCLWVQFACRVRPRVTPGSERSIPRPFLGKSLLSRLAQFFGRNLPFI